MKNTLLIAILTIGIVSMECTSDKKVKPGNKSEVSNKVALQTLHFPKAGEDTLKASYFTDTVVYIALETTKESFIDDIKLAWINDSIILICGWKTGILMFKKNGKFLRKIGKEGRGPGEYTSILGFNVILDTIYISSLGRRGFLRYTFDGNYCDEIKCKNHPQYFSSTTDEKLAYYDQYNGKVYVYNKNFQTPDTIRVEYGVTEGRYYYSYGGFYNMCYLQKSPSGLLFNNYISDTIWNISGNKKEPAFILELEDKLLPYDKQIEFNKGDLQGWREMAKSYNIVHVVPFSSWMFIFKRHYYGQIDAIYINNIKTGEFKKFNTSFIYDDIVGKQNLIVNPPAFLSKDYIITISNSRKKLKEVEQNKATNKEVPSPSWLNQMKAVKEGDNPILAIIKIKKN